jgi:hypothetical protein
MRWVRRRCGRCTTAPWQPDPECGLADPKAIELVEAFDYPFAQRFGTDNRGWARGMAVWGRCYDREVRLPGPASAWHGRLSGRGAGDAVLASGQEVDASEGVPGHVSTWLPPGPGRGPGPVLPWR